MSTLRSEQEHPTNSEATLRSNIPSTSTSSYLNGVSYLTPPKPKTSGNLDIIKAAINLGTYSEVSLGSLSLQKSLVPALWMALRSLPGPQL